MDVGYERILRQFSGHEKRYVCKNEVLIRTLMKLLLAIRERETVEM